MHLVLDTCIDVFTKVANDRRCHATVVHKVRKYTNRSWQSRCCLRKGDNVSAL